MQVLAQALWSLCTKDKCQLWEGAWHQWGTFIKIHVVPQYFSKIMCEKSLSRDVTKTHVHLVQFSSVAQLCPTLCDPMNHSTPGLPVHHQLPEFTRTHAHRVGDAIQPSHPLSSPSPPAPNPSQHQGLFQWVNSSHEVAKVLEFQLLVSVLPMNTQDYIKSVHCHPTYLTYTQSTSWETWGWKKHKLESRLLGEIPITSDRQMIPPLWQKVKRN